MNICADRSGEGGGDECDYCGERDVCDMGTVVSGLALLSSEEAYVRGQTHRQAGRRGARVDDRRRAAYEQQHKHRRWPAGRSTCVIGSVGEGRVANGWPWRAGDITCRAATTWSGRGV